MVTLCFDRFACSLINPIGNEDENRDGDPETVFVGEQC